MNSPLVFMGRLQCPTIKSKDEVAAQLLPFEFSGHFVSMTSG
jgi:hypothetical protein